jgi:RND family efflux transporter MFP subunit
MNKQSVLLSVVLSLFVTWNSRAEALFTVAERTVPETIQLDGVVQPVNRGTVAAQTSGRVVSMYVDVNDFVKKGTVLLDISSTQQTASYDSALAQLSRAIAQNREAQAQIKRYRRLFSTGAVSQGQFDTAQANARSAAAAVKSARAAVTQAKDALGYTSIRAPYDGIVTQRLVELGETVSPGTPLISGYAQTPLRVETQMPQKYRHHVNALTQFQVETSDEKVLMPEKYVLFRYANVQSHTSTVRLRLPDQTESELTPGMWVKVLFRYGQRQVLAIPKEAVIHRGELTSVYRQLNKKLILNPIRIGQTYGSYVEVLSGLEAGDKISAQGYALKGK